MKSRLIGAQGAPYYQPADFIIIFSTTEAGSLNLETEAIAQGWNGTDNLTVRGTTGITIYGTSTSTAALTVPASISLSVGITFDFVTTQWFIWGLGGAGGGVGGLNGGAGGLALDLQRAVNVLVLAGHTYSEYIKGGGGGGGSAGCF